MLKAKKQKNTIKFKNGAGLHNLSAIQRLKPSFKQLMHDFKRGCKLDSVLIDLMARKHLKDVSSAPTKCTKDISSFFTLFMVHTCVYKICTLSVICNITDL